VQYTASILPQQFAVIKDEQEFAPLEILYYLLPKGYVNRPLHIKDSGYRQQQLLLADLPCVCMPYEAEVEYSIIARPNPLKRYPRANVQRQRRLATATNTNNSQQTRCGCRQPFEKAGLLSIAPKHKMLVRRQMSGTAI
jgi:hypothetical protein